MCCGSCILIFCFIIMECVWLYWLHMYIFFFFLIRVLLVVKKIEFSLYHLLISIRIIAPQRLLIMIIQAISRSHIEPFKAWVSGRNSRDPGRGCVTRYASRYIRYGMCRTEPIARVRYNTGNRTDMGLKSVRFYIRDYTYTAYARMLYTEYCIRAYAVYVQSIKCIRRKTGKTAQDARRKTARAR